MSGRIVAVAVAIVVGAALLAVAHLPDAASPSQAFELPDVASHSLGVVTARGPEQIGPNAVGVLASGSITGVAVNPSGKPQTATVGLRTLDGKTMADASGTTVADQSVTAATGSTFAFSNIPDGTYNVFAFQGPTSRYAHSAPTAVGLASGVQSPSPLVVSVTDPQFAGIVKYPDGTVVTTNVSMRFTSSDGSTIRNTSTYTNGTFKVGGLSLSPSGVYTITASAPNPPAAEAAASTPVTAAIGSASALSLTITLNPVSLKGRVVMPDGTTPVSRTGISLVGAGGTRADTGTRSDGVFFFGGLAAQAYTLSVHLPRDLCGLLAPAPRNVTVTSGTTQDLGDLRLSFEVFATGSITGVVQAPDGSPVTATAALRTLDNKPVLNASGSTVTNRYVAGICGAAFGFADVPDGDYLVTAYQGSSSPYAASPNIPVRLAGGVFSPSPLVLRVATPQFQGVVQFADGTAITTGVGLRFTASDSSTVRNTGTFTDGTFKVGGLPVSSTRAYTIVAFPANPPAPDSIASTPIAAEIGSNTAFSLAINLNPVGLKGRIVMPDGTLPVSRTGVSLVGADGVRYSTGTGTNGVFLFGALTVQTYTLRINPPFDLSGVLPPPARTVTITSGAPQNLGDLRLALAVKTLNVAVVQDTGIPTNTGVYAAALNGSGSASTRASAGGVFTLSLGPGRWNVNPFPTTQPATWVYGFPPKTVEFGSDPAIAETKRITFNVRSATNLVTGTVARSDGTSFPAGSVLVRIQDVTGFGNGAYNDASGNFTLPMPAGTYEVRIPKVDPMWSPPPTLRGTEVVIAGATSVGTITFARKDARIDGMVVDGSGTGVGGIPIQAWRKDGSESETALTDDTGAFSVPVISGTWQIRPVPLPEQDYAYMRPPQSAVVLPGAVFSAATFTVLATDTTINGTLVDSGTGAPLTALRGMATATGRAGTRGFVQTPIVEGRFSMDLPHGQYNLTATFPPGSGYGVAAGIPVDPISAGATLAVTIPVSKTDAAIQGTFLSDGAPLRGVPGSVWANGGSGRNEWTRINPDTARYLMNVSAGLWHLRGFIDPEAGNYAVLNSRSSVVTATTGTTSTLDFDALRVNATIKGSITHPDGRPLGGLRVWAVQTGSGITNTHVTFNESADASGVFTLPVPAGTYRVQTAGARGRGLLPPVAAEVTVADGTIATVDFQYRPVNARIVGTATIDGGGQPYAFVRAHPTIGGGSRSTTADASGRYTLTVTGGLTWTVQGIAEVQSSGTITAYRSIPVSVTVAPTTTVVQNLALQPARSVPDAVAITFDVSQLQTIVLSDGTQVIVPAGAFGSSGTATLRVTPKSEIEQTLENKPVDLAYELAAFDKNGQAIYRFNSPVSIVLKYDPDKLPPGTRAEDLVPQYWDPVSSSWKQAENVVVNATEHTVTTSVTHFTDFAVMSESSAVPVPETTSYAMYVPVVLNSFAVAAGW